MKITKFLPFYRGKYRFIILIAIMTNCTSLGLLKSENFCYGDFASAYSYSILPRLDTLQSMLTNMDSVRLEADLTEFLDSYTLTWLHFIPTIGLNISNLQPMFGLSTSPITSYYQNKKMISQKIKSIKRKAEIQQKTNQIKLINLYHGLNNDILQLNITLETLKKYNQLYEIKCMQHKENEINTETFLTQQVAHIERKKVIIPLIDIINEKFATIEMLLNAKLFETLTYHTILK